jgi:hypothetical protein
MALGVLRARAVHERLKMAVQGRREAEKAKRAATELRAWAWQFTNHMFGLKPKEPIVTPPYRERTTRATLTAGPSYITDVDDEIHAGPPMISGDPENWTTTNFYEAADFAIMLANRRFDLMGVTRKIGSDEKSRDNASVRSGVGKMALEILQRTPGFDPKRRPLASMTWKRLVADIANPLFSRDNDITEREVGDCLAMAVKAAQASDPIKTEHSWYWGIDDDWPPRGPRL